MKIEIDLNNILGDEYGAETLQESVRRQVVEKMSSVIKDGIGKKIDFEIAQLIDSEMKKAVQNKMDTFVGSIVDAEYIPVDRYGSRGQPTTFRAEMVKHITENMKYVRANYESDKNAFTKAVDSIIGEMLAKFKTDFNKEINAQFTKEALAYAQQELAKKLGIKA